MIEHKKPTDWIKRQADSCKETELHRDKQREWAMHKHRIIEERGRSFWDVIATQAVAYAEELNTYFDDPSQRISVERSAKGDLTLRRAAYPAVIVHASYDAVEQSIHWISNRKIGIGHPSTTTAWHVPLDLADSGEIIISSSDLAREFIEHFSELH